MDHTKNELAREARSRNARWERRDRIERQIAVGAVVVFALIGLALALTGCVPVSVHSDGIFPHPHVEIEHGVKADPAKVEAAALEGCQNLVGEKAIVVRYGSRQSVVRGGALDDFRVRLTMFLCGLPDGPPRQLPPTPPSDEKESAT